MIITTRFNKKTDLMHHEQLVPTTLRLYSNMEHVTTVTQLK